MTTVTALRGAVGALTLAAATRRFLRRDAFEPTTRDAYGRTLAALAEIQEFPKTTAGRRTIALPAFVVDLLERRRAQSPTAQGTAMVFPSPTGRLRDPHNTSSHLRRVLDRAGFDSVSSHVFRKTVATRLDEAGLSARQIAGHLGHNRPSLTQDVYMGRGLASPEAAVLTLISDVETIREAGSRTGGDECSSFVRRNGGCGGRLKRLTCGFAPPIGLEPITLRLTVACSAN